MLCDLSPINRQTFAVWTHLTVCLYQVGNYWWTWSITLPEHKVQLLHQALVKTWNHVNQNQADGRLLLIYWSAHWSLILLRPVCRCAADAPYGGLMVSSLSWYEPNEQTERAGGGLQLLCEFVHWVQTLFWQKNREPSESALCLSINLSLGHFSKALRHYGSSNSDKVWHHESHRHNRDGVVGEWSEMLEGFQAKLS